MSQEQEMTVMIVDDSDLFRKKLSMQVKNLGYEVVAESKNARDALETIKKHNVDIVISDVVMPISSGIELCETITNNFKGVSVILVSSLNSESIVFDAISSGASDFLLKPIDDDDLQNAIAKTIDMKKNAI